MIWGRIRRTGRGWEGKGRDMIVKKRVKRDKTREKRYRKQLGVIGRIKKHAKNKGRSKKR